MSDLSILTLVKNRREHLEALVEGVRRSNYRPTELIVIDMSDEPIAAPLTPFPLSVIRLDGENLPLSHARNLAARHASSHTLLFLDVDCIPMHGLIGEMEGALSKYDAIICAPIRYLAADDMQDDWTETALAQAGIEHPARSFPESGLRRETDAGLFWSLAFGVRKKTFTTLGAFDECFIGYGAEDTDFSFRAQEASIPLLFKGGAGAFHQHHTVYDPPLHHFDDIVRNAELFQLRWGFFPMRSWIKTFEDMGLVAVPDGKLVRLRPPSPQEIENARQPGNVRF